MSAQWISAQSNYYDETPIFPQSVGEVFAVLDKIEKEQLPGLGREREEFVAEVSAAMDLVLVDNEEIVKQLEANTCRLQALFAEVEAMKSSYITHCRNTIPVVEERWTREKPIEPVEVRTDWKKDNAASYEEDPFKPSWTQRSTREKSQSSKWGNSEDATQSWKGSSGQVKEAWYSSSERWDDSAPESWKSRDWSKDAPGDYWMASDRGTWKGSDTRIPEPNSWKSSDRGAWKASEVNSRELNNWKSSEGRTWKESEIRVPEPNSWKSAEGRTWKEPELSSAVPQDCWKSVEATPANPSSWSGETKPKEEGGWGSWKEPEQPRMEPSGKGVEKAPSEWSSSLNQAQPDSAKWERVRQPPTQLAHSKTSEPMSFAEWDRARSSESSEIPSHLLSRFQQRPVARSIPIAPGSSGFAPPNRDVPRIYENSWGQSAAF